MINGIQKVRIAAHIGRCVRTVHRVYLGKGNDFSKTAVREAAAALGYPMPPDPVPIGTSVRLIKASRR